MKKNIFDFEEYKPYLEAVIQAQPLQGHGYRAKLADGIGCQRAFVSQVLQGNSHFNLEHADRVNQFLEHSEAEADFFLLLVQKARAGTPSLEKQFARQVRKVREARLVLKNRMAHETEFSSEDKQRYYSSWQYGAVRIAASVPELRTREAMAKRLRIPLARLDQILEFLVHCGFLRLEGDTYHDLANHMHLGNDSALIAKHHTNWRLRAMQSLDQDGANDLHYSTVMSISKEDANHFKKYCVEFLDSLQPKISRSKEETVCALGLDWYEL